MKTAVVAFTQKGALLCQKITGILNNEGYSVQGFSKYPCDNVQKIDCSLTDFVKENFKRGRCIVFVGAMGIAVRSIAPYIQSKDKDCAIIVTDEKGKYVIPVLSGHLGGANKLSELLAAKLEGQAVITTATDINDKFAVDVWAKQNNLRVVNIEEIKNVSARILKDEAISIKSDVEIIGKLPYFITKETTDCGICISVKEKKPFRHTLNLCPMQYVVGIGCKKDTPFDVLKNFYIQTLLELNIKACEVWAIATINIKKDEDAINKLCEEYGYELIVYTAKELESAVGNFTVSEFVKKTVGVDNVCERAAILATNGETILKKTTKEGVALSVAKKNRGYMF